MTINASDEFDIDFGEDKQGENWRVINDAVMGGLSLGQRSIANDSLIFSGDISLQNNGGFSSLKSPFSRMDLSRFQTIEIRYRHQGHPVAFTLEWHPRFYKTYHKMSLPSTNKLWETIRIPLKNIPQYRLTGPTGRLMSKKDLKRVIRLGFIASEKEESEFEFEIDYVKFAE